MFCGNCGSKLKEGAKFCPSCGSETKGEKRVVSQNNNSNTDANAKVNVIFVIASFFVPILGLIFFSLDKDKNPKNSRACAIAGIVGFVLNIVIVIFSTIIGVIAGIAEEEIDSNYYRTVTKYVNVQTVYYLDEE